MAFAITAVFLAIWNRKKNKWGHVALFVEHMIDKRTGIAESVRNSTGSAAASKSCFFYICILVHNEIFIFYILFWSVHKWTLFVWYFIYNFFISARFHHWQIKHFQFFEARLLCLRFRRFGAFAIFPGAFINLWFICSTNKATWPHLFFLRFHIAMKTAVIQFNSKKKRRSKRKVAKVKMRWHMTLIPKKKSKQKVQRFIYKMKWHMPLI